MPQVETSNRQNITSAASKRLLSVYVGVSLDLGRFASIFNFASTISSACYEKSTGFKISACVFG